MNRNSKWAICLLMCLLATLSVGCGSKTPPPPVVTNTIEQAKDAQKNLTENPPNVDPNKDKANKDDANKDAANKDETNKDPANKDAANKEEAGKKEVTSHAEAGLDKDKPKTEEGKKDDGKQEPKEPGTTEGLTAQLNKASDLADKIIAHKAAIDALRVEHERLQAKLKSQSAVDLEGNRLAGNVAAELLHLDRNLADTNGLNYKLAKLFELKPEELAKQKEELDKILEALEKIDKDVADNKGMCESLLQSLKKRLP